MRKNVILFLAANPLETHPRKLAEECAEIQRELRMAPHREDFRFETRWAVGIDELMRHLVELDPAVIHFSGHGSSAALLLQDEQGKVQRVTPRALAMMLGATAPRARVVVLNTCDSVDHARELRSRIDCVIGMDGALGDEAARAFAIRFYGALGARRSVGNAVAQGIAVLAARQLPDERLPRCLTRDGIDGSGVFLDPRSPHPRRAGGRGWGEAVASAAAAPAPRCRPCSPPPATFRPSCARCTSDFSSGMPRTRC